MKTIVVFLMVSTFGGLASAKNNVENFTATGHKIKIKRIFIKRFPHNVITPYTAITQGKISVLTYRVDPIEKVIPEIHILKEGEISANGGDFAGAFDEYDSIGTVRLIQVKNQINYLDKIKVVIDIQTIVVYNDNGRQMPNQEKDLNKAPLEIEIDNISTRCAIPREAKIKASNGNSIDTRATQLMISESNKDLMVEWTCEKMTSIGSTVKFN